MKTFENVFDTLIVILLCLLVFVVLVRGEDTIICKEVPGEQVGPKKLMVYAAVGYNEWGDMVEVAPPVRCDCPEGTRPVISETINASDPPSQWYTCHKPKTVCDTIWDISKQPGGADISMSDSVARPDLTVLDSIEWMRKEVGEWITDTSTGHWDYRGPTKEDILEILRGILDDPCPCTDTAYIPDTVYVPNMGQDTLYEYILDTIELRSIHNLIFDFSTAAKQAARRTNEQFGGHPDKELNSINNKEK